VSVDGGVGPWHHLESRLYPGLDHLSYQVYGLLRYAASPTIPWAIFS
jgi:hypothetical protein